MLYKNHLVSWLCFTSNRQLGHLETAPHLLSLAKDVELGFITVPTGNRTPGRRGAVHYTTAALDNYYIYMFIHYNNFNYLIPHFIRFDT